MAFLPSLFGSSGQLKQLDRFNPQQQNVQNQALGQFGPLLQQLQKPADINPILNQRRQSFQTDTLPSIAERFSSLGGSGQRSSAFQNAVGRAGSDLETQLASLQSQVGYWAILVCNRHLSTSFNQDKMALYGICFQV
jgi:hypothetical protein